MAGLLDLIYLTTAQLAVTWILVGIMWFSQVVHYPLYKKIKEGFVEYERSHIKRSALLLAPLMVIEAITAFFLISESPSGVLTTLAGINLIFLILIWLSTFLFQVSFHQKLSIRFSPKILRNLITSNWVRTILWTLKGLLMICIVYHLFQLTTLGKKLLGL
ncbi:MAG: hypothetical protein KDK63_03435 [Chlamydiia bacterium]|nr:hypothetical protein [Chlamydiia bacterium]MCB1116695.1 hypothetical protein [Chlamydiia bacterium]